LSVANHFNLVRMAIGQKVDSVKLKSDLI